MTQILKSALDVLMNKDWNPEEIRNLRENLFEISSELKRRMDQGLTPDEMTEARGLREAAEAAFQAVEEMTK